MLQVKSTIATTTTPPDVADEKVWGRLRVLHVVPNLSPGGTEYVLLRLIRGLGSVAFEHHICATRAIDVEFAERHGIAADQMFLAGKNNQNFQFPLFRLARYMRSFQPHVVHTRNWGGLEGLFAARLAGVPVLIHSEHGYEVDSLRGVPMRRRMMRRAAYALADVVFTNSNELRAYHSEQAQISPDRIRVIYNGVDTQRFAPKPEARHRVRQSLGLPMGSFVVGSVGRLVPIKDHGTLLSAASILADRSIDVRVLLVGTGPSMADLERQASRLDNLHGRVYFVGASEEVPDLLNAMDVYVQPSLGEGMSNTLIEAMATGLPVLATRVGGNPEIIEDSRTGWLFAPGDIGSLANHLEQLFRGIESRRVLGSAARKSIVTRFDFERMIANYRTLYLEQAGRREIVVQ